jgi:hypothetical protein
MLFHNTLLFGPEKLMLMIGRFWRKHVAEIMPSSGWRHVTIAALENWRHFY